MKLGGSLERRRSKGRARRRSGSAERFTLPAGSGRLLLLVLAVLLLGSGSGYLYATHVVFPASKLEATEFETVPDLTGLPEGEARVLVENRGLGIVGVDSILHPRAPAGEVVGQTPLPGQLAVPGGAVELTVSLGPERRPVPDVTRLRADRAIVVLETTGFEVLVDSVEADEPAGRVVATRPGPGTSVTLPAEIQVTVSLGPPMMELPDLVGLQEARARAVLDSLGLVVGEVEPRFRFGFNQGEVLETFPEAGALVPRGGAVRLVVGRRGFFRDDGPGEGG